MARSAVDDRRGYGSAYVPHPRVQTDTGNVSLTRQEFADECDINVLMSRFEKTGIWPGPLAKGEPRYFDFTEMPEDFRAAMDMMVDAEKAFMSLPADVRREFDNSPAEFVDYATDPANLEQMREWGLAPPAPAPIAPTKVEVVNPPTPPEAAPKPS